MASTRFRTTKRAGAVALALAAGSTGVMAATSGSASASSAGLNWDKVAQCESGGNWSTNTGNGFSGGLQFTPSTWAAYGGSGNPASASKSEQIAVANRVLAAQGPGAWPVCSRGAAGSYNATESTSHASRSTTRHAVTHHAVTRHAATKSAPATTVKRTHKSQVSNVILSRRLERQKRADVAAWQSKLDKLGGFHLAVDGYFGPKTEAATKALQQRNHRVADGEVGPSTRAIFA